MQINLKIWMKNGKNSGKKSDLKTEIIGSYNCLAFYYICDLNHIPEPLYVFVCSLKMDFVRIRKLHMKGLSIVLDK